jgi:DNA gyrase subunit A
MLITSGGVLIRTRVNEIREMGRSTQGVTLINLAEGEKLSGLQRIMDRDDDNGETAGTAARTAARRTARSASREGEEDGEGPRQAPTRTH